MKKFFNYSPNFDLKKRKNKDIKFLIFHYTGMRNEKVAIDHLTDNKSKVSCHYFIKENGIQGDQIIRKIFEKSQDLEISLKRDIDEFNLMNGQNNSAIDPNSEELLIVSESEADPINL